MPIIRSSRLYVCYYRLWCAVLGCWLSGVRCRAAGCASRMMDVARLQSCYSAASSWFFFSTLMQRRTDIHTSSLPKYIQTSLLCSCSSRTQYVLLITRLTLSICGSVHRAFAVKIIPTRCNKLRFILRKCFYSTCFG